jgi:hypothetical protein
MKHLVLFLFLCSCGFEARNNELVGQVKKVIDVTPLICGDYTTADISLGVVRNGTGSMSKEDVIVVVDNHVDVATLKKAAETGDLVKVTYDVKRATVCEPDHRATAVMLMKESGSGG